MPFLPSHGENAGSSRHRTDPFRVVRRDVGDDGKKNILKIPPGTAEMIHMVRLLTGTLKLSRLWGRELR
jgi:hypothetical protein